MYLFFDTETTGLARASDRIVQIAWIVTDEQGHVLNEESHVLKPDGYTIPQAASNIHGITTGIARRIGRDKKEVLQKFLEQANLARVIVTHNIAFDLGILRNELFNAGMHCSIDNKHHICTMKASTSWCALPKYNGSSGYKWPKLEELHYRLFGNYFDNAHDALADTRATLKCFFELESKRIIVIPKEASHQAPFRKPSTISRNRYPEISILNGSKPRLRLTQAVEVKCMHCLTTYDVTLNRYETWARCPKCHLMSDARISW